ncbi:MAG: hypothetical protein NWR41_03325 [Rickettsiaceae bacterium]|nr:hypothetical protein [Rickettsiaceae bacterium]
MSLQSKKIEASMSKSSKNNIFDSDYTEDAKHVVDNLINSTQSTMCSTLHNTSDNENLTHKMVKRLSSNISNVFEHNMQLGQGVLQCKTAGDVIDFQRKLFECNFKHNMKLCMDLAHDIQKIANHNVRNSTQSVNKNIKCLTD